MRFLLRPTDVKDLRGLLRLSRLFPLGSLPQNKARLEQKIQISKKSFKKILPPENRNHLFVMEDLAAKKLIASSQILSRAGKDGALFWIPNQNSSLLRLKSYRKQREEIGGLILDPAYRKNKERLGLQMGLVRFLYMMIYDKEFSPFVEVSLTAPVRGGSNRFWEETGDPIINKSHKQALLLFQKDRRGFFRLFPEGKEISLEGLSAKARQEIGKVGPQTLPVIKGLLKRGFKQTKRFHALDGGPCLSANRKQLPFLKKARLIHLKKGGKAESFFLIAQASGKGFFCVRAQGSILSQTLLLPKIPKGFNEGEKACALPFYTDHT